MVYTMELSLNIITVAFTLIGVAVIGVMKYYERLYGSDPEAWSREKLGQLVIAALIVMLIGYVSTGLVEFPSESTLTMFAELVTLIMTVFGSAYALLTGSKLAVKSLSGVKTVAAIPTTTAVPVAGTIIYLANGKKATVNADGTFTLEDGSIINCAGETVKPATVVTVPATPETPPEDPNVEYSDSQGPGYIGSGFKVDPSNNMGVSPFAAELRVEVGMSRDQKTRPAIRIDWQDGSPVETFTARPADGVAWVKHTYTYVKGKEDKYFSKQFFPIFYVIDAIDGRVSTFNLLDNRRCCWVLVESPGIVYQ